MAVTDSGGTHEKYESPLGGRYSSPAMQAIFTNENRYRLWRRLWAVLARAQEQTGYPVTSAQAAELEEHADVVDLARASAYESESRHEVMAHIRAFGDVCPNAKPIIHLGATSAYVMDNGDIMQMREALKLVERQLEFVISALAVRAAQYRELPVLGYTHYQPAQLTTLGKRICLWISDLLSDLAEIRRIADGLPLLGMKGATGTQASLLALAEGDAERVDALDRKISEMLGFKSTLIVTGQTYPRKIDSRVYAALAGIAESATKFATDIRLLQHDGQLMEPFGKSQVGSSAMPYKRNPMKCERICGLSRLLITTALNGNLTAGAQWLERTLDDSSNRRLAIPQAFLLADSILHLAWEIARGFEVGEAAIARDVARELPFIATEEILMQAVKSGGDRQQMHERLRVHSIAVSKLLASGEGGNDLLERLRGDPAFKKVLELIPSELDPAAYTGLASRQVGSFLEREVRTAFSGNLGPDPWGREITV
ncbi:MAG: adenylosuccinate lyase [Candidatus Brocadiia bacterium]